MDPPAPLTDPGRVAAIAREVATAGRFALDLEFASESRYVPELGLVQVAWGDPEEPQVAAIDPLAVDVAPLVELVAAPEVETVLHAAQGDLSVLAARCGIAAENVFDTQIAAAFAGVGDQVGYGGLVEELLGVVLDKGMQFTRWLARPLSAEQLRYALDDVRYLPRLYERLAAKLAANGHLGWVMEESQRVAGTAAGRPEPEEMYRRVGGWGRLKADQRGVLRELAAWREREALATNRPPAWIVKNAALLELARRQPASMDELAEVAGIGERTIRRRGRVLLAAIRRGRQQALPAAPPRPDRATRRLGERLHRFLGARSEERGVPQRFVATRSDADALADWWLHGERASEPGLPLLGGWRRQAFGEEALAWLAEQQP